VTNVKVYQGFHNDKKVKEHYRIFYAMLMFY